MKLSVVVPVFNERATIHQIVAAIRAVPLESVGLTREIVLVDDCSRDGTRDELKKYEGQPGMRVLYHEHNQGKGAALRRGFSEATWSTIRVNTASWSSPSSKGGRMWCSGRGSRAENRTACSISGTRWATSS